MKVGPLEVVLSQHERFAHIMLHTGQHYDRNMNDDFFRDFNLRAPDIALDIHGGGLGDQTGRIMMAFEKELLKVIPDLVVVVGDVNSTFAAAWVAVQNHIKVAHVESGLRSFDRLMPEEINRICTDAISDLLFTTHPIASDQLIKEDVSADKIFMVGDIMIDYLVKYRDKAAALKRWQDFGVKEKEYGVLTLHRPSNVDDKDKLGQLMEAVCEMAKQLPLVFAMHPRTRKNLKNFGMLAALENAPGVMISEPLSYMNFLSLVMDCKVVLTDSGGLQEETTFLNIPCITMRENTERPFCVDEGTNYLEGTDPQKIKQRFTYILSGEAKQSHGIEGWDGKTAEKIVAVLEQQLL